MTVTAAMIAGVITQARSTFPTRCCKVRYGENSDHEVNAFHNQPIRTDSKNSLDGLIEGLRGELIITISDCAPWNPPSDGDQITLFDTSDVLIGEYYVLGHSDEGSSPAVFRRVEYGEESA